VNARKLWHDEIKAEPLTVTQMDNWLAGRRSRRILVVPFGGPLPGGKAGLDLDGDAFDAETDLFGNYPTLRTSRERLVDWHHDADPTGVMKGAILGQIVMDSHPESDGLWADFWANAGEKRRALMARLEGQGVPLYGSSQALTAGVRKSRFDGGGNHVDVWPLIRHTITTSPQNPYAVVPSIKALLAASDLSKTAIDAAMLGDDGASPIAPDGDTRVGNAPGNDGDGLTDSQRVALTAALDELEKLVL
jgi:hypothetical protein